MDRSSPRRYEAVGIEQEETAWGERRRGRRFPRHVGVHSEGKALASGQEPCPHPQSVRGAFPCLGACSSAAGSESVGHELHRLFWYELLECARRGHRLAGTDAARVRGEDTVLVRDFGDGFRWHRCLRCDAWLVRGDVFGHAPYRPARRVPARPAGPSLAPLLFATANPPVPLGPPAGDGARGSAGRRRRARRGAPSSRSPERRHISAAGCYPPQPLGRVTPRSIVGSPASWTSSPLPRTLR